MDEVPCTYRISVKAIIEDDEGRILLLREDNGSWELPGGGLEHGEDAKIALAREINEEIGCKADWISDEPAAFWTIRKEVGSPTLKWFSFICYKAKVSGEFRTDLSEEAEEIKYFSREEAKTLKLHDNVKPYFLDT